MYSNLNQGIHLHIFFIAVNLNQKQIDAAQDEINILSQINNADKGKKNYSDSQLNKVVADAKKDMANQGQNISNSKINEIVNNQININHLDSVINSNQRKNIIKLLENVRDSGALKNNNFKNEANQLANQIYKDAHNLITQSSTEHNSTNWFNNLIDTLSHLFKHYHWFHHFIFW